MEARIFTRPPEELVDEVICLAKSERCPETNTRANAVNCRVNNSLMATSLPIASRGRRARPGTLVH
jgi:hypothetical protein